MANRLDLQTELESLLGSRNVYFQPPASVSMKYPAIRYSLSDIDIRKANNRCYRSINRYEVIIIDPNPESEIPNRVLNHFQLCSFDRTYVADNLNHFVLTLYY